MSRGGGGGGGATSIFFHFIKTYRIRIYTQYIKKRNTYIFADNLSNFKDVHFKLAGYID